MSLPDSEIFRSLLLPLLIFSARIVDVSIGTMRIIYISKGMKFFASLCGFVEVFIWLMAITQIIQALNNLLMYVGYAGGFAAGNYIGILIEGRLALGTVAIRIITMDDATDLIAELREKHYGLTTMAASGISGKVMLIFSVVKRKAMEDVLNIIRRYNPKAFVSVEDIRMVSKGTFPVCIPGSQRHLGGIRGVRKWK